MNSACIIDPIQNHMMFRCVMLTCPPTYQLESFECKVKELTHLAKQGYGVVVDCKAEHELKRILSHQQPVMVYIHSEEAQQLHSAMKQRCWSVFYLTSDPYNIYIYLYTCLVVTFIVCFLIDVF